MINKDFYFGWFCCFVLGQIHMDMMGKELYMKRVNAFWMPTSVWTWVGVWIIGFIMYVYYEYKSQQKESDNDIKY